MYNRKQLKCLFYLATFEDKKNPETTQIFMVHGELSLYSFSLFFTLTFIFSPTASASWCINDYVSLIQTAQLWPTEFNTCMFLTQGLVQTLYVWVKPGVGLGSL